MSRKRAQAAPKGGGSWWRRLLYFAAAFYGLCGLSFIADGAPGWITLGVVSIGASAGIIAVTGRRSARQRRRRTAAPRALLLALARQRAGAEGAWLNRDQHLVFMVDTSGRGMFRRWTVARADEDQARDLEDVTEGGRFALTAEFFTVLAGDTEVLREAAGVVAQVSEGEPVIDKGPRPGRRKRLVNTWHRVQALRAGHLYASADDLTELVAQFEPAELVSPDQWQSGGGLG